ncbi:MAG: hypothetical protein HKN91_01005, partial [Acidimicrobiia bacterium]|nr:hypothetical protein [Acidimicrobiia bacterium]
EEPSIQVIAPGIGKKVKNWITIARGVEAIDVFIMHISMVVLFGIGALVGHFIIEGVPIRSFLDRGLGESWTGLVSLSAWVSLMITLGAVLAVRSGLRDAGFRRQIGIIWDVTSFWPRHFHPFAPPSYAVRTVPELQERLSEVEESDGAAILSGHSQGSVVAFAAAASLGESTARRTALITHGSPLRRFYARFFPSYFDDELLVATASRVGPTDEAGDGYWLNFHRLTDPIALPVFVGDIASGPSARLDAKIAAAIGDRTQDLPDVALDDPHTIKWAVRQRPPEVLWHLSYIADPKMSTAIKELTALLSYPSSATPE